MSYLILGHAKYLQSGTGNSHNYISIDFAPDVELEYVVLQYDFPSLIVDFGSSLGLWLGLSVVGIYDLIVTLMIKIKFLF